MNMPEKNIARVSDIIADILESTGNAGTKTLTPEELSALRDAYSILHPDHCPKCLSRFETHNGDGSCPAEAQAAEKHRQPSSAKQNGGGFTSTSFNYGRQTAFLGRNGAFKAVGLEVSKMNDDIVLEPVTSKGETGRCRIELPDGNINELINALNMVNGDLATEEEIQAAKDEYQEDGRIEIDNSAVASRSDEGCYVQAWVWVQAPETEEQEKTVTA